MTASTDTLAARTTTARATGDFAETLTPSDWTTTDDIGSALDRIAQPDYNAWLGHIGAAAGCTQPVRLAGKVRELETNTATGEVVGETERSTSDMPDGVIYKACGNRRASSCPACAEIYRQDAYQLVLAGLKGGKGVPEAVGGHPAVFMTLTAPSFGIVHTQRTTKAGDSAPCRARRKPDPCPHGVDQRCSERHQDGDHRLGTPFCPRCYDYDHHTVWNVYATELWRRTTIAADRILQTFAREHGYTEPEFRNKASNSDPSCNETVHGSSTDDDPGSSDTYVSNPSDTYVSTPNGATASRSALKRRKAPVRISFGKVAEFQKRGLVHFHILARLDGIDPTDREAVISPPEWTNAFVLTWVLRRAVEQTRFWTPGLVIDDPDTGYSHVSRPDGWLLEWGDHRGTDIRPVRLRGDDPLTDERVTAELDPSTCRRKMLSGTAVAGYLAKYATKATEDTGHTSQRLTADSVDCYATNTHVGRLIRACWRLGAPTREPGHTDTRYPALRRWAHMLGYGGHFFTKSRRYTCTFRQLRKARVDYQRARHHTSEHTTEGHELVHIAELTYTGRGWHTTGDAMLANTSAYLARINRQTAKEELQAIAS